jgi:hypothetical protein
VENPATVNLTLFVVTLPAISTAQMNVQMELLAGMSIPRAAHLLYDPDDEGLDSEVLARSEADVRALLAQYLGPAAYKLPALSYENPEFPLLLQKELARKPSYNLMRGKAYGC